MTQKLKDFPEELKLFDNYLVSRENEDLGKILSNLPQRQQYQDVLVNLTKVKNKLEHKDCVISVDLKLDDTIKEIQKNLQPDNLKKTDDYQKEEKNIKKYKKSKTNLIESLLDEPAEYIHISQASNYYNHEYKIINLPTVNIGRFHELHSMLINNTYNNYSIVYDTVFCGNLILPTLELSNTYSSYVSLMFMCSADFIYHKNVWNTNCINFMSTKFNAKKTLKRTIDSAIKNNKVTGTKPEWIQNYEMMK